MQCNVIQKFTSCYVVHLGSYKLKKKPINLKKKKNPQNLGLTLDIYVLKIPHNIESIIPCHFQYVYIKTHSLIMPHSEVTCH